MVIISSASTKPTWILALLLVLATTIIRVHGQSPPTSGFISLDCGYRNTTPYTDSKIQEIKHQSDIGFIEGGLTNQVAAEFMAGAVYESQKTLRSFPNGSRNCYTLPSTAGKKFLVRAMFAYGNYDGLNRTMDGSRFLFGLHIGVNFWETVNLTNTNPSLSVWKEVLTVTPGNSVSVCLINFGSGTPFVSSLELRPLQDAMYPFLSPSVSVSYLKRYRFGKGDNYITRYPDDPYDRFWEQWQHNSYPWINLNTNTTVNRLPSIDGFQVPQVILQHASTLDTNYSFIDIDIKADGNLADKSME